MTVDMAINSLHLSAVYNGDFFLRAKFSPWVQVPFISGFELKFKVK